MDAIPQHSLWLVERLLAAYCQRICPPQARNAVSLRFRIESDRATIEELRRICGVPGTCRAVPLAQFRYSSTHNEWRLFHSEDARHWRRYAALPAARSFIELLRKFDRDPAGLFWARIDGKSLRWCSSRGRCAECDEKYCRALGVEPVTPARRAAEPL